MHTDTFLNFHPIPIAILPPLPPCCHYHSILISSLLPWPPHPHCHPLLPRSCCHHVATPSSFHLVLIAVPCPPHLHCCSTHCHPVSIPVPIATPSIFPLLLHGHPFPIATSSLFPPLSYGHLIPMTMSSLLPPYPYCHLVPIDTPSLFPPYFRHHPLPMATPSLFPPHPVATPLWRALTGVPSRLPVPVPPDAAAPCHTIMSLAECNGESSRCLCFSCSPHSCHFQ